MSRTNLDGKPVKLVLEWLLNRSLTDADLAEALGMAGATYSRRKDADDYPSFSELEQLANRFGVSGRMLQIAFGWRGLDELVLLDEGELKQWVEQGGGNHPSQETKRKGNPKQKNGLQIRPDMDPL